MHCGRWQGERLLCAVTLRPSREEVRPNQWERSSRPHGQPGRKWPRRWRRWRWWRNTRTDCDWPEKYDISRMMRLLSLESTNHGTINRRGWWETRFPFFYFFMFYLVSPARLLIGCFFFLRVFTCVSRVLTPPPRAWCHHVVIAVINIIMIKCL